MDHLIRRVVTATDLSEASLRAVERAMGIAALTGSHCTVVHALGLDALARMFHQQPKFRAMARDRVMVPLSEGRETV